MPRMSSVANPYSGLHPTTYTQDLTGSLAPTGDIAIAPTLRNRGSRLGREVRWRRGWVALIGAPWSQLRSMTEVLALWLALATAMLAWVTGHLPF
jgi:hypothetical protein